MFGIGRSENDATEMLKKDRKEVDRIDFVELTPEAVREVLGRKDRPHRTYFKLAFALALWRRGLAELDI